MATFWLTFAQPGVFADKRFLGVVIVDAKDADGQGHVRALKRTRKLGVNPGGAVKVQEISYAPDEHKNKLITDDELLMKLGSAGRKSLN